MDLDSEELVMRRSRDCSSGGVDSKVVFRGHSGVPAATAAVLWWLETGELGSGSGCADQTRSAA